MLAPLTALVDYSQFLLDRIFQPFRKPKSAAMAEEQNNANTATTSTDSNQAAAQDTKTGAAGRAPVDGSGDALSALVEKLAEATSQAADYKDKYIRTVAEFDNFRRRSLRERDEARFGGQAALLGDLLPAFDNLSRGLEAARQHHPEAKGILEGIAMVQNQIAGILNQYGVKEILPEVGADFNPTLHEAVAHMPSSDVPEGKVSSLVRGGFQMNDRLVRPASVVVSSGPADKA